LILQEREIEVRGIPYLAKNERDMGTQDLWPGQRLVWK
jgi:hypothetical protein